MKLGVFLGMFDPLRYADLAIEAEQLGFESVWVPEHLVLPVQMEGRPGSPEPVAGVRHAHLPPATPLSDCLMTLAHIAAKTSHIRLGTCVLVPGLRHPFVTARALATLDQLSGGRLEAGVGAGWLHNEWRATQVEFAGRGRRLDEIIEICRRLWSEQEIGHEGEFFRFEPVMFEPKPLQPGGPRFHIGGDSPAALDRAGRLGDGWMAMSSDPASIGVTVAAIDELRAEHGRADTPFQVSVSTRDGDTVEAWRTTGVVDRVLVGAQRDPEAVRSAMRRAAQIASSW